MNRIKHKITVVLALFGVVFIAPVALAQDPVTANDNANIEIIARPPVLRAIQDLEFGQIFRPTSGSPDYRLVCGATGNATLEDATPSIAASGIDTRQCGQINLIAGDVNLTGYTLNFGAGTTDLVGAVGGADLETTYVLYGATDNIEVDADSGTAGTATTGGADVAAGATRAFYVGGTVTVPNATSTAQVYIGTYELVLTIP